MVKTFPVFGPLEKNRVGMWQNWNFLIPENKAKYDNCYTLPKTPSQGSFGTGLLNLKSPTGGFAKGIPMKAAKPVLFLEVFSRL